MTNPRLCVFPLKPEEAEQYMRIRHQVFSTTTFHNVLYAQGEPSQKTLDRVTSEIRDRLVQGIHYLKCVDTSTSEMIAGASWHYLRAQEEGAKERPWEEVDAELIVPEPYDESDPEMYKSLFTLLNTNKRKILGNRPYYALNTMVTLPNHERRGAGNMLVRWGCDRADEAGVPAYVEASLMGAPMYARHGFQRVKQVEFDLSKWGGKGVMSITLMLRPAKCE
ncbi:hypothetical protein BDW02DRAFT_601263 [Decorospora gaudefroyi]|uniref:N-acetyltransferase domain-containing protein n=1 Tax=Decorospora gaudefroyi TaxID=184978 RepID=A0A6A5K2B8_9PLEO|nr:hypothetical protein BDW02DRAFT_601263 [Decorospora gaudefroyi]